MIIDLILDRKQNKNLTSKKIDGKVGVSPKYDPKQFYNNVMSYYETFKDIVDPIATALDSGEEKDVKRELCRYIIEQEYNLDILKYINSVKWL